MQSDNTCAFASSSQALSGFTASRLLTEVECVTHSRYVIVQVDVTEVFRQIPRQKVIRIVKLVIYLIAFVYFIFR